MVLLAGLTRQHIYSQRLLTFSVTSLHQLHLGSYQTHRYNDLVLSAYFCAAIIGSSFQLHPLSLCRTCFAVARAPADAFCSSLSSAFYCLWSSQQVIIWSCKKIKRTVRALIRNSKQLWKTQGNSEPKPKLASSAEKSLTPVGILYK